MTERTLSIVKPDAIQSGYAGAIVARIEKAGLKLVAAQMTTLSKGQAQAFYAVHKARPFFADLVNFMISGPILVSVFEGDGAILKHREIMGATDPAKAAAQTLRKDFGESIERNAVHGSDAADTAKFEIGHFFAGLQLQDYSRNK